MLAWTIFFAIINPPEAAILAIGAVQPKPVINSAGQIAAGKVMNLTLSCDHRVIDGVIGARFMGLLRNCWNSRQAASVRRRRS